jgi:hypothetical protein
MGSFDSGFRMGQQAYQQSIDNDRQKVLDGYKADEMARQKATWGREDKERADVDAAFANVQNVRSGISPEQQGQIKDTYGMTPGQTAAAGPALPAKLASYDVPDSYDLQTAGSTPAFNAQGLALKKASDAELERANEGVYLAKRDLAGVSKSKELQRGYGMREITDATAKMPLAEIEKMLPQLNTNTSQYPMLYTGKGKGGYSFLSTESDGSPGKSFTMNEAQLRQLASAHALGNAGFGAESMAALNAAHKDIGDHVTKWNDATVKAATSSNTATHYAGADERDGERIGIARGALDVQRSTAERTINPFTAKKADYERALERPLTESETLNLGGLAKGESAELAALVKVEMEGVKAGTATPEQAKARIQDYYAAPKKALNISRIVTGLREEHAKGGSKASQAAVSQLQAAGYPDAQIAGFLKSAGIGTVPNTAPAKADGKPTLPSELGRGSAGTTSPAPTKAPLQQAYDDWQASKSAEGGWFNQKTPSSAANAERTKALEQAYTEMLRNQPVTR